MENVINWKNLLSFIIIIIIFNNTDYCFWLQNFLFRIQNKENTNKYYSLKKTKQIKQKISNFFYPQQIFSQKY